MPDTAHFPGLLTLNEQRDLAARCLALGAAEAGFYTPVVRGQYPMTVRMLCLGRHWNAVTYGYEHTRSDIDQRPVPALPPDFSDLARRVAAAAGFVMEPDICIVNWYRAGSKLGVHQDKDERRETLERGAPVVSLSLGDTAVFRFGGLHRRDPLTTIHLESGDAFVFGGAARLCYHGVARILTGTAPSDLGFEGRLNLTFREW